MVGIAAKHHPAMPGHSAGPTLERLREFKGAMSHGSTEHVIMIVMMIMYTIYI